MQHLDEGILQAWLDRPRSGLDPSEVAEIERHLQSCERCSAALEELQSTDARTHALLATGVDRDMPRPPFEEVVRRARGGGRGGGVRLRLNRMAWAASIVVALGVGWMTNEMIRSGAVPVGESVQPAASPDSEAQQAPTAGPSAEEAAVLRSQAEAPAESPAAAPAADADDAARAAEPALAADARPSTSDDAAGAGAATPAPERAAATAGSTDLSPEPAAPPLPADQIATMERRETDTSALADLAGDDMAVVRGVVRTVDGEPVGSAQVYVESLAAGTLSRSDGSYTLLLPRSELDSPRVDVVVERIGFRVERQQVSVDGPQPAVADFGLQEEALQLQEIVVTGAPATVQRRAVGNSVTVLHEASSLEWRAVTRAQAQADIGNALVTSPGLDVVSVEVATSGPDGTRLARVRQDLGDGSVLTLVQGVAQASREAWPVEPEGAVESTRVGELLVTATAPVSSSFLRALVAGLR